MYSCSLTQFWPEQAQVFDRPPAEVRSLLKEIGLPPHVFGSVERTLTVLTPSPEKMVWSITEPGEEELRYVVTLTAQGPSSTRVGLDFMRASGVPIGPPTANFLQRRTVRNVYINAMQEHIAASLERREFQMYKIMVPTGIAVLINFSALMAG